MCVCVSVLYYVYVIVVVVVVVYVVYVTLQHGRMASPNAASIINSAVHLQIFCHWLIAYQ